MRNDSGDFEWTATVYNLNKGKNDALLLKCKPLSEYMELINRIRRNQNCGMNTVNAVNAAVDSCIADGIMKNFLVRHKAEVMNVCITEFDEKIYTESIREEGREEGREQGREQGREEGREQGREEGLKALIYSLKNFLPDFESVYQTVIKNEEYSNVTREGVRKYY